MEKEQRNAINAAAQEIRRLLEQEYREQLEGVFDIGETTAIPVAGGSHLSSAQRVTRRKMVAAIEYHVAGGLPLDAAVTRFVRDAAFTTLNRFVALKMFEARGLLQPCVTTGEDSSGYREFIGPALGVAGLPDGGGYRLYLEALFDELSTEIKVLFDRHDSASLLWPRRRAFDALLEVLNDPALRTIWDVDETVGWFYQFFNSKDERAQMRAVNRDPCNSRELAVRNQFFTPRYIVEFLVDNTLGRTWLEMTNGRSDLAQQCEYLVELDEQRPPRDLKDPRDLRILDPACGSGHFLLYAFDLLEVIYREAWEQSLSAASRAGPSLREKHPTVDDLWRELPVYILENNLHGVEIDSRAAQIAALALWLRAQRTWGKLNVSAVARPPVRKTGIVVAEPMPGDQEMVDEFASRLQPPFLGTLFRQFVATLAFAGDLGVLLRSEEELRGAIDRARLEFDKPSHRSQPLAGLGGPRAGAELDLSGIREKSFFANVEAQVIEALGHFAAQGSSADRARRKLFADDAAQGMALLEAVRQRYDVIVMNPPFGAVDRPAKAVLAKAYPRTKNDLFAAFVERGIELLVVRGLLGALTSRTGLFILSFQKWREEVILGMAPPLVVADLGSGVLDGATVEVTAYCLEARS